MTDTDEMKRARARWRQRRRDLRNPNWGDPRRFPVYTGQTTAEYIKLFQAMNGAGPRRLQFTDLCGRGIW